MTVEEFHAMRRMFIIIDGKLFIAPMHEKRGHKEWVESFMAKERVPDIMHNSPRGFFHNNNLYLYKGEFEVLTTNEVCQSVKLITDKTLISPDTGVFSGMNTDIPGKRWEPKVLYGCVKFLV